jgi:hypothetical protein
MKEVEGVNWSYCSHCSHWATVDKMHVTDKHKTKEEIEAKGTLQRHVAATCEGENGGLQMMGSLMRSMSLCKEACIYANKRSRTLMKMMACSTKPLVLEPR